MKDNFERLLLLEGRLRILGDALYNVLEMTNLNTPFAKKIVELQTMVEDSIELVENEQDKLVASAEPIC